MQREEAGAARSNSRDKASPFSLALSQPIVVFRFVNFEFVLKGTWRTICHLSPVERVVQGREGRSHGCMTITTIPPQNSFHLEKLRLNPHEASTPRHVPVPQPLATLLLLSVSMNVTPLGTSYKSDHPVFVLWGPAYFT